MLRAFTYELQYLVIFFNKTLVIFSNLGHLVISVLNDL